MSKPTKILKIDEKWSIEYDPTFNDNPRILWRHGVLHRTEFNNLEVALFYALLEEREEK